MNMHKGQGYRLQLEDAPCRSSQCLILQEHFSPKLCQIPAKSWQVNAKCYFVVSCLISASFSKRCDWAHKSQRGSMFISLMNMNDLEGKQTH